MELSKTWATYNSFLLNKDRIQRMSFINLQINIGKRIWKNLKIKKTMRKWEGLIV